MGRSVVTINGKTYTGGSISISRGKVKIDGKDYTPGDEKKINILIQGDIDYLEVDVAEKVGVNGKVKTLKTQSGDVEIRDNVVGSVTTQSGDVKVGGTINGDVKTMSGDVNAKGSITGSVSTMSGDIYK